MFKVGDKVVIIKDLSGTRFYEKVVGMIGTIVEIEKDIYSPFVDDNKPRYNHTIMIDKTHKTKLENIANELNIYDMEDVAGYIEDEDTYEIRFAEQELKLYKETPKDKIKHELLMLTN